MPSHAKKGPPTTHVIPEASVTAALENLEVAGAMLNQDIEDCRED